MTAVYRTSALKRRRRTKAELEQLHTAILTVCEDDHPLSVRGVFYRVMSAGGVEKTEKAYAAVQREVLKLRRCGALPYEWIADGTRWHVKPDSWDSAEDALYDAALSYRRALWHDQQVYVEVWSEKEAIDRLADHRSLGCAAGDRPRIRIRNLPLVNREHDPQPGQTGCHLSAG